MDEMEFTEAESNMNDLVSEYQQYQVRSSLHLSNAANIEIQKNEILNRNT